MAGFTQKELASKLGLPPRRISEFETGKVKPSSFQLMHLAKACGARMEYFFRDDNVTLIEIHWCTGID
jgi:transcriptional regulator with XRE-family HTH domain